MHRFPTEASLDELDTFTLSVDGKIGAIEESLSQAVHNQSKVGHQASKVRHITALLLSTLTDHFTRISLQPSRQSMSSSRSSTRSSRRRLTRREWSRRYAPIYVS
jgi:hypothetical protein